MIDLKEHNLLTDIANSVRKYILYGILAITILTGILLGLILIFNVFEPQPENIKMEESTVQEYIGEPMNIESVSTSIPPNQIPEFKKMRIPNISTNSKLFMDYEKITDTSAPHYRLQQRCWTDEHGLRRFNNDYVVALGQYYSTSIGDRFKITLSNGSVFSVILGDNKWNEDCDPLKMYMPVINYDGELEGNLLEFIVDEDKMSDEVHDYGSIEKIPFFDGSVIKIEYLGRDESEDWDTFEIRKD